MGHKIGAREVAKERCDIILGIVDIGDEQWDDSQWNRVVSSDESSFTVRPTSLKKRIWREANTKFELRNLDPTFKSRYGSPSVWCAFCAH